MTKSWTQEQAWKANQAIQEYKNGVISKRVLLGRFPGRSYNAISSVAFRYRNGNQPSSKELFVFEAHGKVSVDFGNKSVKLG